MFDTHCHLNTNYFDSILNNVITKARESGVNYFLVPGFNLVSSKKAVQISSLYKNVFSAVGIHPAENLEKLDIDGALIKLEEMLSNEKCLAVGEIGLDYYKYKSPVSVQKDFYKEQLKLALKMQKAVIIHNRHATKDIISETKTIIRSYESARIVFHCVSPEKEILKFCIERNIYMGVDGDLTYDNRKREFVKLIPNELLLVETDAPYLMPKPIREIKRFPNEPGNLKYVIDEIAKIKNKDVDAITQSTTKNAMRCFNIGKIY